MRLQFHLICAIVFRLVDATWGRTHFLVKGRSRLLRRVRCEKFVYCGRPRLGLLSGQGLWTGTLHDVEFLMRDCLEIRRSVSSSRCSEPARHSEPTDRCGRATKDSFECAQVSARVDIARGQIEYVGP